MIAPRHRDKLWRQSDTYEFLLMNRQSTVLSEFERDQVSERTHFVLANKRLNGEKTVGNVPFGFRSYNGRLIPDPAEQVALVLIRRHV